MLERWSEFTYSSTPMILCVKTVFHLDTGLRWKRFCQMLILLLLGSFLVLIIQYYHDCPINCFIWLFLFGKVLQKQNPWWTHSWHLWTMWGLYCSVQVTMKSTNKYTVQAYRMHIVYILLSCVPWMQSAVLFTSWSITGVKHSGGFFFPLSLCIGMAGSSRKLKSGSLFPLLAASHGRSNHFTSQ